MKINFLCNKVFDGWKPTDTRLGGTEESIVQWCKELEKLGHQTTIYDNDTRDSYAGGDDVCINIKSSDIPPKEPTLYLTNETNATELDLSAYQGVIWPSEWAKKHIPVNNPNVYILPHGYDPEQIYPGKKIKKQCLYASSPDRGLERLLEVWPEVNALHPDATLVVTYGADVNLPGVINLGEVDEETMNDLYRTSDVWCHPDPTNELFCISGVKAQVSGCIPVITPAWALSETVKWGYFTTPKEYGDTLIKVLSLSMSARNTLRKESLSYHYVDWRESTERLLKIINSIQ